MFAIWESFLVFISVFAAELFLINLSFIAVEKYDALPRCEMCGARMMSIVYHFARCKGRKGISVGVHAFKDGQRPW
jgi:hypothetical protein